MKKILAAVLAALMITGVLAGCASNTGKYTLYSMSMGGMELTAESLAAFGVDVSKVYIELKAGNKFEMVALDSDDGKVEGTYKISGKNIALTAAGADGEMSTLNGTIENKTITIEESGSKMTFKKK